MAGKKKVPKLFRSLASRRSIKTPAKLELPKHHAINVSLGSGSLSPDGAVLFIPSPTSLKRVESDQTFATSSGGSFAQSPTAKQWLRGSSDHQNTKEQTASRSNRTPFLRKSSSFLRVADLDMTEHSSWSDHGCKDRDLEPNYHHPATDPPPGVDHDPKEFWIALNDGGSSPESHAPIAPLAMERLADFGLMTSLNDSMWTPDGNTQKILKGGHCQQWMKETFKPGSVDISNMNEPVNDKEVLIWVGNFKHGLYGSELPTVRAAGVVNMSAKSLMELMVDSNRVKEYNKFSLGRDDVVTFQDDMGADGPFGRSITKVMKSETKPPMVRKTISFVSILHAKKLPDGSGYLMVSRAVHHPEEEGSLSQAMRSEILMGVNLIRTVKGREDSQCLMINVNHIRSPMIPMMLAKRIGLSAAANFLHDIRAVGC